MYSSDESFQRSREGYFGVYEYPNNTRLGAESGRTCIVLFLTRHNESMNDYRNDEFYTSPPCLTRSVFGSADDGTMTKH